MAFLVADTHTVQHPLDQKGNEARTCPCRVAGSFPVGQAVRVPGYQCHIDAHTTQARPWKLRLVPEISVYIADVAPRPGPQDGRHSTHLWFAVISLMRSTPTRLGVADVDRPGSTAHAVALAIGATGAPFACCPVCRWIPILSLC